MKRLMMALLAMFLPAAVLAADNSSTSTSDTDDVLEELDELRGEMGLSAQIAIVLTVPVAKSLCRRPSGAYRICPSDAYLLGSTIEGFPTGTVSDNSHFADTTLPAGTYLVEIHQPRSDQLICHGSNSTAYGVRGESFRLVAAECANLAVGNKATKRLDSGSRIYTVNAGDNSQLRPWTRIPLTLFGNAEEHRSYTGSIKVTRLR